MSSRIPPTVWALGWVSFCSDVASEMIYPLLPLFLTRTLGAPMKAVGLIEGGLVERLGMRVRPIGLLDLLPAGALNALRAAESATRQNGRMLLNVAVGYGGRHEIVDAVRGYLRDCFTRGQGPEEILSALTPDAVDKYLYTYDCPDLDLIIRTSGEVRLSGFMLWQSAYSEFYFCDVHWPAFRKIDFLRAIRSYQHRHRRFGR